MQLNTYTQQQSNATYHNLFHTMTTTKAEAKETFKSLLIEHKGDAKHPDVSKALDNLIELAAKEQQEDESDVYASPAHNVDINKGKWRSITTPPFRGKLDDETDDKTRFTLGRMR